MFFENPIIQLLADIKARCGSNEARSVARTDAHTRSQKNVSTLSSSLQLSGFSKTNIISDMHVRAINANLSYMPLCSRCGNDILLLICNITYLKHVIFLFSKLFSTCTSKQYNKYTKTFHNTKPCKHLSVMTG